MDKWLFVFLANNQKKDFFFKTTLHLLHLLLHLCCLKYKMSRFRFLHSTVFVAILKCYRLLLDV